MGAICVGIIGNEFNGVHTTELYFLIATSTFFIGTFTLFISYLLSPSAASIIPKTIYELVYHSIASVLLLSGSIALMVHIHRDEIVVHNYKAELAAGICCLLNTVLYICGAILGFGTYGDD